MACLELWTTIGAIAPREERVRAKAKADWAQSEQKLRDEAHESKSSYYQLNEFVVYVWLLAHDHDVLLWKMMVFRCFSYSSRLGKVSRFCYLF